MKIDTYPADAPPIIAAIKQTLAEEQRAQVVRALRHEPVFWEGLKHPEFRALSLEKFNGEYLFWSPGNLALLALDIPAEAAVLRSQPTHQIDNELAQIADQTLKNVITGSLDGSIEQVTYSQTDPLAPLKNAGLVALALRERFLVEGNWLSVLLMRPEDEDPIWSAALTCLYTFTPEPYAFLKALINPETVPSRISQGIHAILSNPLPLKDQHEMLLALLQDFTVPGQVTALDRVREFSPALASTLATDFSARLELLPQHNSSSITERIYQYSEQAVLLGLAGEKAQAVRQLEAAWRETLSFQSDLAEQLATFSSIHGKAAEGPLDIIEEWQGTQTRLAENDAFLGRYAIALIAADRISDAEKILEGAAHKPIYLLAKTLLANHRENKDKAAARKFARKTIAAALNQTAAQGAALDSAEIHLLTEMLIALNAPYEAIKAAQFALSQDPSNPDILKLLGQAQLSAGHEKLGATTFEVAVLLEPDRMDLRQRFAEALEAAGNWEAALRERTTILERVSAPSALDLRALANCALQNGEAKLALEVCDQALHLDTEDGLATSLKGRALLALGKTENALKNLRAATQLSPHHPTPWLNLAAGWQEIGDPDKVVDTLRTATHAVPDSADIYFTLGREYDRKNALTQAVEAYENGARLDPTNPQIALHHGKTLLALGHLQEAREVVQEAYEVRPGMVDLAYTYAQIMSGLGEPQVALQALATVIQSEPDSSGPYLEYGRALIQVGDRSSEAVKALSRVRKMEPDNVEAMVLFADAMALQENYEEAISIYHQVLGTPFIEDTRWRTHLSLGIAQASLLLGRQDAAIATLREALDHDPENTELYRCLAESYTHAELRSDALESAQEALRLGADDLENLTWFAEIAGKLQAEAEALSALKRALELAPGRTDLHVLLGHTQLRSNQHEAAWESFNQLVQLNPEIEDLKSAAEGFLQLDDPGSAADYLTRAIELSEKVDISLWILLFRAQLLADQLEEALATIDQAIDKDKKRADLHLLKARAMLTADRPQAARACLQHALNLSPEDSDTVRTGIEILQQIGEFAAALDLADKYLSLNPEDLGAYYKVADLARSLLQYDYAFRVLREGWPLQETNNSNNKVSNGRPLRLEDVFSYYCLYGEICLEKDDELAAAEGLTQALRINDNDPRVLALQARLEARTGDRSKGLEHFKTLLEGKKDGPEEGGFISGSTLDPPTALSIAAAALDLHAWQVGIDYLRSNPRVALSEPFANLNLARFLAVRAETYLLYHSLEINRNLPEKGSVSDESYREFKQAISAAQEATTDPKSERRIARWSARGETAFAPSQKSIKDLADHAQDPTDHAALVQAYGRQGDLINAIEGAKKFPHHPVVQTMLAAALHKENPTVGQQAAQIAVGRDSHQPVYLAALAYAASHSHETSIALQAIEKALAIWPDEAHWHILAANLLLEQGPDPDEVAAAIEHYEEACALEPSNPDIFKALGKVLKTTNDLDGSIEAFETAASLDPHNDDTLYLLAGTYYAKGDLEKANARVDAALAVNQEAIAPHQLRATIALDQEDPYEALTRIQTARSLAPADPKSLRLEAKALSALNRPSEALSSLENALPESDDPLPLLIERIHLIRKVKGKEAALQELQQLNSGYPDDPEVFSLMAHALAENNQVEDAIFAAKQAIRKGAEQLDRRELGSLHHLLGRLLRRSGQRDQAIHYLSEAIHLSPQGLDPYLELSKTYLERRDYADALEILDQAIKIAPDDNRAYYQAGLALKENKEYLQSEKMLRRAAELSPNDLRIHRLLGAVVALNIVHNNREAIVEV